MIFRRPFFIKNKEQRAKTKDELVNSDWWIVNGEW
jgi:hypothetical protein